MKNDVLYTPEELLVTTIKDLQKQMEQLKANQASTVKLTNSGYAIFTVPNNTTTTVTMSITPPQNQVLIAVPEVSIFKGTVLGDVSDANQYPQGANWTGAEIRALKQYSWLDWGDTDNENMKYKVMIVNETGSSKDIILYGQWRYILPGSA